MFPENLKLHFIIIGKKTKTPLLLISLYSKFIYPTENNKD